jgi:hypothetical protein
MPCCCQLRLQQARGTGQHPLLQVSQRQGPVGILGLLAVLLQQAQQLPAWAQRTKTKHQAVCM